MCGIVGYIGKQQAAPILLDGLEKLEYRGYDSAGIAVYDGKEINMLKAQGRLKVLNEISHGGEKLPGTSESGIRAGPLMGLRPISMRIHILMQIKVSLLFTTELLKII